jgi:hypothetical protein
MTTRDTVVPSGYDEEERYFHEKEMELLRSKRRELDRARQQRAAQGTAQDYWMRCPKCGGAMNEVRKDLVLVDTCGACGGVYFDKGELEILLSARKPRSVWDKLFR